MNNRSNGVIAALVSLSAFAAASCLTGAQAAKFIITNANAATRSCR